MVGSRARVPFVNQRDSKAALSRLATTPTWSK
jgi:hypothetical protein